MYALDVTLKQLKWLTLCVNSITIVLTSHVWCMLKNANGAYKPERLQ